MKKSATVRPAPARTFSGICADGPLEGRMLHSDRPVRVVQSSLPESCARWPLESMSAEIETATYHWHDGEWKVHP